MVKLDFNKIGGLVPAVIQDHLTGEVLMLGFMNEESWNLTLKQGTVVFYSRSRKKLWKKGETSGHVQIVKEIRVDCDDDALLIKVEQVGGAACHTGYRSCFFRKLDGNDLIEDGLLVFKPEEVYRK
jgi:phosphoribosyl-AMP cyclohydrolase